MIYLEYNAELIPISEDMHFESLLVAMDPDPEAVEEYQYVAQMYFVEDLLNIEPDPEDTTSMATLQFVVNLPCQFDIDNESRFFHRTQTHTDLQSNFASGQSWDNAQR